MKKEFVLPEYWYAEINESNIELIKRWRFDKFGYDNDISNYNYINCLAGFSGRRPTGWKVCWISNDQLLAHVLHEYTCQPLCNNNQDMSLLIKLLKEIK